MDELLPAAFRTGRSAVGPADRPRPKDQGFDAKLYHVSMAARRGPGRCSALSDGVCADDQDVGNSYWI